MLTDHWDIAHYCVAVPDLEAGMKFYEQAFGIESWGPLLDFTDSIEMPVGSQIHGDRVSMVGMREIWSRHGSDVVDGSPPLAPLELAHAKPFTPSFAIWGCRGGREYVHHVAYWVDDLEAESAHLLESGFELEVTVAPGDRAKGFAYHLAPTGMRIELMGRADKAAIGNWLAGEELELDWASES